MNPTEATLDSADQTHQQESTNLLTGSSKTTMAPGILSSVILTLP